MQTDRIEVNPQVMLGKPGRLGFGPAPLCKLCLLCQRHISALHGVGKAQDDVLPPIIQIHRAVPYPARV